MAIPRPKGQKDTVINYKQGAFEKSKVRVATWPFRVVSLRHITLPRLPFAAHEVTLAHNILSRTALAKKNREHTIWQRQNKIRPHENSCLTPQMADLV